MSFKALVFSTAVACEVILVALILLTLALPRFRAWPPPERRSWQYGLTWGLVNVSFVGLLLLGALDGNSGPYRHWSRFAVGGTLLVLGVGFAFWGIWCLSWHTSLGLDGDLVTGGAYQYSRNPQYVGDILWPAGYAILCNSELAAVVAGLGMLWFALVPFAEEPWLKARYGAAYRRYKEAHPRFLGWPTSAN